MCAEYQLFAVMPLFPRSGITPVSYTHLVARIDNLGNVAAVHKVFEYGKLLLLAVGNGKLPILRDNGEIEMCIRDR